MKRILIPILSLFMVGCADDPLPKPKGYLRLDYPDAKYKKAVLPLPFTFEKNVLSDRISKVKTSGETKGVDVKYPSLKATIYLLPFHSCNEFIVVKITNWSYGLNRASNVIDNYSCEV